ncbi:MAG: OmpA family protein [Cellulophaga sp.]
MKKSIKYLSAGLLLFSCLSYGQKLKKADKRYESYAFKSAIETYKSLHKRGLSNSEIYQNLGDANYFNANYKEAAKWYLELIENTDANFSPEYIYKYAQSIKSTGDYEKSAIWMAKYVAKATSEDVRAVKIKNQKDYLEEIESNSGRYKIENMNGVNSAGSDFAPSITKDGFYFASARDTGLIRKRVHDWNDKGFLDIYSSDNGDVSKLSKVVNSKYHESTSVVTKDGKTMYFTRNNFVNGKVKRDGKDIMRLKIYKAKLVKGDWKEVKEVSFSSDLYSVAHPALSPDEKQLFFVSDMPNSVGASDIYYVSIKENDSYGKPINAGKNINTEGRESFPFISKNGTLFFSSDGHPGLGGLDVFAIETKDLAEGKILNLGKPVNSVQDDFTYVIDSEINEGYFASNRKGGKGDDDIYFFVENEPIPFNCTGQISGVAKDKGTQEILANVSVGLTNSKTGEVIRVQTDAFGAYSFDIDCNELKYDLIAMKEYYDTDKKMVSLTRKEAKSFKQDLLLDKQDLVELLQMNPIYFDYDKSNIRKDAALELQKVVAYLNKYPNISVEVRSHTDSRGKARYNLRLSDRRAKSTAAYIIAQGIDSSRISGNGYGEKEIENGCTNGVKCSDNKHEQNRRSEFIINAK